MHTPDDALRRVLASIEQRVVANPPPDPELSPACGRCGRTDGARRDGLCAPCHPLVRQRAAGFYEDFLGASLADFPPAVSPIARALLEPRRATRGLFVMGPTGTGKTRLCAAIVGDLHGAPVRFGLARSLLRRTWNPETQDAEIRALATTPLLILDDLGREGRPTPAVCATLHEILSERNGNYLPTIATSNVTIDVLAQHYDEAIADRMRAWTVLVLDGKSRRGGRPNRS